MLNQGLSEIEVAGITETVKSDSESARSEYNPTSSDEEGKDVHEISFINFIGTDK